MPCSRTHHTFSEYLHRVKIKYSIREYVCIVLIKDSFKISKTSMIRKEYNQVPHLTQDTTWESNRTTINITNKSQDVSPYSAGDYKAINRRVQSIGIKL